MDSKTTFSKPQTIALIALRVAIGWHFLYEGIIKITSSSWSSLGYLMDAQGFMSSFFQGLATNPTLLHWVDVLNIVGLIAIGVSLMIGGFTRLGCWAGILLLSLYYLSHIPFIGAVYMLPTEGSYLWIDKNIIEIAALFVIMLFPTSHEWGLDYWIEKKCCTPKK